MGRRVEFAIIALLSLLAALRVLVFSAGLPLFSQVDEEMHFDLVLRYAREQIPHRFELVTSETLNWIVPYASPEFLQDPKQLAEGRFSPPLWKQSGEEAAAVAEVTRLEWSKEINWECSQPPLYYSVAALWWKFGQVIGLSGISAIYWLRFLNAPLICAVVWLAYAAAHQISSHRLIFRIGVPAIVACFPQDVFFIINNDTLSAFCGGLIFFCATRVLTTMSTPLTLAAGTGLSLASGYLTKTSNGPLALVFFAAVLLKIVWNERPRTWSTAAIISALCLTAITPVVIWTAWIRINFGDLTGGAGKAGLLGWTIKPFSDWWNHPIFSLHGLWAFWSDFAPRFWRGELMWHGAQVSSPPTDIYYSVASVIALVAAAVGLMRNNGVKRFVLSSALFSFLASVLFLTVISIAFDFGRCIYPSRAFPYLTAGRLIIGEVVPFAILFIYGLSHLFHRLGEKAVATAIILTVSVALISQALLDSRVFASEHNWFNR